MRPFKDITGQKLGELTAIRRTECSFDLPCGKRERKWILKCSCGKEVERFRSNLKKIRTCGSPPCTKSYRAKEWEAKKGFKVKGEKVTSWQRLQQELKHLRATNARLLLEINNPKTVGQYERV